jgi:rhodanese-related sulfurtransferase
MVKPLAPADLRRLLDDGDEIAVLDVREEGVFARDGHLLHAANLPLSHLEMRVTALLPRATVRIVVCDDGGHLAPAAGARLIEMGYSDVSLLCGGVQAWSAAGYRLYTGVYVPSKAFGEFVLHRDKTPEVTAGELLEWKAAARDVVIIDSRPFDEYRRHTIPGAINCPGAELAYRINRILPTPGSVVVVNCGGRTRSIIGAQSLINAGIKNPVYALKDGTQGWHLQGHELARNAANRAPEPTAEAIAQAQRAAARVAKRFGVRNLSRPQFDTLRSYAQRTVYVLDVRSPEEFEAGHLPGSRSAPGGQLVQATDTYMAVRRSTAVLVDDNGVRATMTAAWLIQMGWDHVFVLNDALVAGGLETGVHVDAVPGIDRLSVDTVSATELHELVRKSGTQVIDLNNSLGYREGHIPGAWHAMRSRLKISMAAIPGAETYVFTSPDALLARFTANDALFMTQANVRVLAGGAAAWQAAGYGMETGTARLTCGDDDLRYRALDTQTNVEAAIRDYLSWEVDLLKSIESDPDFGFRRFD